MFYATEILLRKGKFGIIWLAATQPTLLTKRDFYRVNVIKSCESIIDYILGRGEPLFQNPRPRFSLYLSAKLMYGTVLVHKKQIIFLLDELLTMHERIQLLRDKVDDLMLPAPRANQVTMKDPLQNLDDPFFGMLSLPPAPILYHMPSVFVVGTPRSPERERETLPHTADRSSITMEEPIQISFSAEEELIGKDLPPLEDEPPIIEAQEQPEPMQVEPVSIGEVAAEQPPLREEPEQHAPPQPTPIPSPPKRARRHVEDPLRLPDVTTRRAAPRAPSRRRRRGRRGTNIDRDIYIVQDRFKSNICAGNQKFTVERQLPSLLTDAQTLFTRPGQRVLSKRLCNLWRDLKTLPERDDEQSLSAEMSAREATIEMQRQLMESSNIEAARAMDSAQSLMDVEPPMISIEDISGSQDVSLLMKPASIAEHPIPIGLFPILEEEPTPEVSIPPENEEGGLQPDRRSSTTDEASSSCVVSLKSTSPLRDPSPLVSPEPSRHDVYAALLSTREPRLLLSQLLKPRIHTRKFAATYLYKLLGLHSRQLVRLEQSEGFGDITIHIVANA